MQTENSHPKRYKKTFYAEQFQQGVPQVLLLGQHTSSDGDETQLSFNICLSSTLTNTSGSY
jgi:hypothetical protein